MVHGCLAHLLAAPPASGGNVDWSGLPIWSVIPFAVLLLAIAILPLTFGHWWEHNKNKLIVSLALGLPIGMFMFMEASARHVPLTLHDHPVFSALHEYAAFILLLFALFAISGGIYVRGTFAGTPTVNTGFLAVGALIASFVGTTGASMLLIRPLLRANAVRKKKVHVVVFFIFVVSNCGGLLTPLGDPPLFLGFLRGVPFGWTFNLWKEWALVNGALLVIFHFLDAWFFHREDVQDKSADLDEAVEKAREPFGIEGGANFLLLLGVVGVIYASGEYADRLPHFLQAWGQPLAMALLAVVSLKLTPKAIHLKNQFSFVPIVEVAALFIGIFLAMIPALKILNAKGPELGVTSARSFFWATGVLSSFLDNAPTYLTFASVAAGLKGLSPENLAKYLALGEEAVKILAAISCGAVMMGANTYIGNGPNFMVKAIAEQSGVKMPSFFGYMGWSIAVLIPLFAVITLVFF
ncbi:MAG: sodium:proton antiporter [Planctomycetes bacterium]|nr:sodium:proton antiporter [Planctomycetota bacterium]